MKTQINKTDIDWIDVKNKCRTTVNKDKSEIAPTQDFKKQILISEHSPIRLLKINWLWQGIKSFVSVHFTRHHIGIEKWVSTQRTDRTGVNRDDLTQGELVNMELDSNVQATINMARVRLCYCASPETRELMEDLKITLHNNKETREISDVLVPNCIYRCGCPEGFSNCKFFEKFKKDYEGLDLFDIQNRYDLYNEYFYEQRGLSCNEVGDSIG